MNLRYKRFFFTVIGYFAGNVFTKLISFILLPLYTNKIDPEIFGIYGVNMTIVQLVVGIIYICIWQAVFRYAADSDTQQERYEVVSMGLLVMWVSSFICTGILLFINCFWNLHNPYLVCVYAVANGFQYFYGYVARSMKDNRTFIVSGCVNSTVNLMLNWVGIVYLHHGIETLYYSYIIGTLIQVLIIELKYKVIFHFRKSYIKISRLMTLFRFGGPLAINSVMQWFLTGLTQVMIANMLGTYYNGLFSVAVKFATLISLIVSIFEYAWLELAYDLAKGSNSVSNYRRVLNMLFGILAFGSSVLMLGIKVVFPWFIADTYRECLEIIPHIVVYASANAFASFVASIYMSYKDVNILVASSMVAGVMNFIMLELFTPKLGFRGALFSLVAASVIMMLIRVVLLKRKYVITLDLTTVLYVIMIPASGSIFYLTDKIMIDVVAILVCFIVFIVAARSMYFKYMRAK